MNQIIPAYNDPLFSILLIVAVALLISLINYGWSLYRQHNEENHLIKFLEQFDNIECTLDTANMPFESHMEKPLSLLAKAFEKAGEYHKAITIYLYLIKHTKEENTKQDLMELLGGVYFQAGFLVRAETIYEEILRLKPRNIRVLYALAVVYETKHEYTKVEELFEPFEILDQDIALLQDHIRLLQCTSSKTLSATQKITKLNTLIAKEPRLYREVIRSMFLLDTQNAWRLVDTSRLKMILDILWNLPYSQLDLETIKNDSKLSTLYYVKGLFDIVSKESGIFALDILAHAKENGYDEGELHFIYLCTKCKQSFPISFKRCPNCMTLHAIAVEEYISKANLERNYSLL